MAALGPFDSFHLFCVFSIFVYSRRLPPPPPPSKALINKRKLRKPVGTSEKEAADKRKEKEEEKKEEAKKEEEQEKEEEEQDEGVAVKSSARTATRSSGLVRTSSVKVWYRIRASNNITTHRVPSRPFDHSPRETPTPPD
jgi:hypothetical protein